MADFIEWLTQQDFYENTTVIIAGDHPTMDSDYINEINAGAKNKYDRKAYFAVINSAEESESRAREYTTMDIFPTTLAALGVEIEGEQLGLGVNLFSEKATLLEQYGIDYLNQELTKQSAFYEYYLIDGADKVYELK